MSGGLLLGRFCGTEGWIRDKEGDEAALVPTVDFCGTTSHYLSPEMALPALDRLREAAADTSYVSGLTHNFYRHPARFSPALASAAIECFSRPGSLVLDPFMGGGTTLVEALAKGRRVVGADINPLSVFVARAKTTALRPSDPAEIERWSGRVYDAISYLFPREWIRAHLPDEGTRNLHLPQSRAIKKGVAIALRSIGRLSNARIRLFARCVILKTAQWALDGRSQPTSLGDFREKLLANTGDMLAAIQEFGRLRRKHRLGPVPRTLLTIDARRIHTAPIFAESRRRAQLVLTSPPYPGIHAVYNRWQVDGRRETPAPYWITGCPDGNGLSYYTFGDRREPRFRTYFEIAAEVFQNLRRVVRKGGYLVQVVAFSNPDVDLDRYLAALSGASFEEVKPNGSTRVTRIWRDVPNRRWHAVLQGATASSREVVLIHRAV